MPICQQDIVPHNAHHTLTITPCQAALLTHSGSQVHPYFPAQLTSPEELGTVVVAVQKFEVFPYISAPVN